ncbi:MAG: hypothetical protein R3F14_42735 [Polyangiaceae bacterium]
MSHWGELPEGACAARRPLPEEDDSIAQLSFAERRAVGAVWAERARSELTAAALFSAVSRRMFGEPAPADLLWLAARAVCDEMRHSEICRVVAERYLGEPVPRLAMNAFAEPRLGAGAYAVLQGSVNETIGSVFLAACLEEATAPLARAALRELSADETDHARIGWATLGASPPDSPARREVQGHLPSFIREARRAWLSRAAELPETLPPGHGCLPRAAVVSVVDRALREVVLPGFAHVGLDPAAATQVLGERV